MELNAMVEYFIASGVYQWHKAAKSVMESGYYLRARSYSPSEGSPTGLR